MIIDGKDYKEIEIGTGLTIKDAVKILKQSDELAYVNFNGVNLYSDTVTIDDAYKAITGMTQAEFAEKQRKERDEWTRKEEEHKKKIPELTKQWIEKGHSILDEKYWKTWDEVVPIRLSDLYQGMELGCTLAIVEKLNAGCDFAEARELFDGQGHSGMSAGLMFAMLRAFCDRGDAFVEAIKHEL